MRGFYFPLIILFAILSALIYFLKDQKFPVLHDKIWIMHVGFFLLTLILHQITSLGLKNKKDFHVFYFISIALRFIFCIILVFIILKNSPNKPLNFLLNFFALYLIYTSFEIYFLLRNLRADLKK
jgi:hypothetical protein